jgi:hypothetical protein
MALASVGFRIRKVTGILTGRAGDSYIPDVRQVLADENITDADENTVIEISGARTLTIDTLTDNFQACKIIQMTADVSTMAGTFVGDYGQTTTAAIPGSEYTLVRVSTGDVYFHLSA